VFLSAVYHYMTNSTQCYKYLQFHMRIRDVESIIPRARCKYLVLLQTYAIHHRQVQLLVHVDGGERVSLVAAGTRVVN